MVLQDIILYTRRRFGHNKYYIFFLVYPPASENKTGEQLGTTVSLHPKLDVELYEDKSAIIGELRHHDVNVKHVDGIDWPLVENDDRNSDSDSDPETYDDDDDIERYSS